MSDRLGVLSPQKGPWADGGRGASLGEGRGRAGEKEQLEEEKRKRRGRGRGRGRQQEVSRFFAGNFALAGPATGAPASGLPTCLSADFFFLLQPPPPQRPPGQGTVTVPTKGPLPHPPTHLPGLSIPLPHPHPSGGDPQAPFFSEAETEVRLRKERKIPAHRRCSAEGNRGNGDKAFQQTHPCLQSRKLRQAGDRPRLKSSIKDSRPGFFWRPPCRSLVTLPLPGEVWLQCPQGLCSRV